jgi:hypothetical protein
VYLPAGKPMPRGGRRVREVVVVGLRVIGGETRERPRPATYVVPRGFRLTGSKRTESYVRLRYRASRPALLSPLVFLEPHLGSDASVLLYQP